MHAKMIEMLYQHDMPKRSIVTECIQVVNCQAEDAMHVGHAFLLSEVVCVLAVLECQGLMLLKFKI